MDDVLVFHAQWRTALGTVPGLRYPGLSTDLGRHPNLITAWQTLAIGDRVQVTSPPYQHPPGVIDQLVEGRSQTLSGRTGWTATMITSPAEVYTAWVVEGAGNLGRLDADGSTLSTAIDADDTTVIVTGSVWTVSHTAGIPFDLDIGGERVTATDITGTSSPQTMTIVRGVDGLAMAHSAGTKVRLWKPGRIAL